MRLGCSVRQGDFFDTLQIDLPPAAADTVIRLAEERRMNLRRISPSSLGISLDETTGDRDVEDLWAIFNGGNSAPFQLKDLAREVCASFPEGLARTSKFLTHPVFNRYHSETEMMRYLKRLESRDLSLTTSMIPLGSCTMKLNAAVEMLPITWPEFNRSASVRAGIPDARISSAL